MEHSPHLVSATLKSALLHPSPLPLNPTANARPPRPPRPTTTAHPPARSARPHEPTLPHRIYRPDQRETVTPCNPKNHSYCAPPPRAMTPTRKFPKIPANPMPTTTSHPIKTKIPPPGARCSPSPSLQSTRTHNQAHSFRPWAFFASGRQGTFCDAHGKAASPDTRRSPGSIRLAPADHGARAHAAPCATRLTVPAW